MDDHEQRIQRLLASGVLSAEQARRLEESLASRPPDPGDAPGDGAEVRKKARARYPLWPLFVLALLAPLAWFAFTGSTPAAPDEVNGEITQRITTATADELSRSMNEGGGIGGMKAAASGSISLFLLIGVPALALAIWVVVLHNGLVDREEEILTRWAQVESSYQRRADLIPNLVATVSEFVRHEAEVLGTVTAQRSGQVDAEGVQALVDQLVAAQVESAQRMQALSPETTGEAGLKRAFEAQELVGSGVRRLLAVSESYPTLRSSDQFLALQAELEGTENRINVARLRFNESVGEFNASIRRMPASSIASFSGFERKAYFRADEAARKPVSVFN